MCENIWDRPKAVICTDLRFLQPRRDRWRRQGWVSKNILKLVPSSTNVSSATQLHEQISRVRVQQSNTTCGCPQNFYAWFLLNSRQGGLAENIVKHPRDFTRFSIIYMHVNISELLLSTMQASAILWQVYLRARDRSAAWKWAVETPLSRQSSM